MFSEAERMVFSFHDGTRERKADPLAVRRALIRATGGSLYDLGEAVVAPRVPEGQAMPREEPGDILRREEAQGKLLDAIRQAFGLLAFDPDTGEGVTEATCWRLWNAWGDFLAGEPTPAGNSATSQPSTDCPPVGNSTTETTSGSS